MNTPVLEAKSLAIGYKQKRRPASLISEDLGLDLKRGEIVCLIGPNGVGKSTLLRTLAGLQPPLAGEVLVEGKDIAELGIQERAQRIGIVLTERVDVGMLTSFALVSLGRHPYTDWTGRLADRDVEITLWAFDAVGATDLINRFVGQLSDGERQKVMIARALAQEPNVIILDEPTAYLDLPRRVEILGVLKDLAHKRGRTILLSTHDLDIAIRTADRLWVMGGEGTIDVGAPEDLILEGTLEAVFEREGVAFDREHGSFVIANGSSRTVTLHGSGTVGRWTARALERTGFLISENGSSTGIHIEIVETKAGTLWKTISEDQGLEHSSLHDLLAYLRTHYQS